MVVPASSADAIWLARDLAGLMDEIETEGADWAKLAELVPGKLAGWWQVTLDFLEIVTAPGRNSWRERDRSNPAAHRSALIRAEATRLRRTPPAGPVIAAGSTGSIPATAELLAAIAGLPQRRRRAARSRPDAGRSVTFRLSAAPPSRPACSATRNIGLARLIAKIGVLRGDVERDRRGRAALARRAALVGEALRPAETTERGPRLRAGCSRPPLPARFAERDAGRSRQRARRGRSRSPSRSSAGDRSTPGHKAALVTGDRELARRVSADSCASASAPTIPAARRWPTPRPAGLLRLALEAVFRPGDPVGCVAAQASAASLGLERADCRHAAELVELVALRGATGRPDIGGLGAAFERGWPRSHSTGIRRSGAAASAPPHSPRAVICRSAEPCGGAASSALRPAVGCSGGNRRGRRRRRWRRLAAHRTAGWPGSTRATPARNSPTCCAHLFPTSRARSTHPRRMAGRGGRT